mmetsp:Transcript_28834/g.63160  ORF Transcript_28834/g.63160 Transcript_28834/m.63160 type:complete len:267 (+) Transcript_28834:1389-2189(+)
MLSRQPSSYGASSSLSESGCENEPPVHAHAMVGVPRKVTTEHVAPSPQAPSTLQPLIRASLPLLKVSHPLTSAWMPLSQAGARMLKGPRLVGAAQSWVMSTRVRVTSAPFDDSTRPPYHSPDEAVMELWRRVKAPPKTRNAGAAVPERQRTTCESRITTVAAVETAPPDRSARQSTKVVLRMVAVPAGMWKAPPSPSSDWHSSTETSRASKVGGSSSVCESTRAPPPCRAVQPLICTRSITAFTASRLSAPPSSSAAHRVIFVSSM